MSFHAQLPPPKESKELCTAIEDDNLYKARDDAKKRAVFQGGSYEDFQNMVATAHLRPVQDKRERKKDETILPEFTLDAAGKRVRVQDKTIEVAALFTKDDVANDKTLSNNGRKAAELHQPRNSAAFERSWRRSCDSDWKRYEYIRSISPDNIELIFKVEINSVILGEALIAIHEEWKNWLKLHPDSDINDESCIIANILNAFTKSGRFSLNSKLIGSKAKIATRELFDDLANVRTNDKQIAQLKVLYSV